MRKTLVAASAMVTFAVTLAATAEAASADPVLQRFKISIVNQTSQVKASGIVVNDRGTATPTSATSYQLSFPSGPGDLTETVQSTTGGLGPGCVERLSQTGTFEFSYTPTAQPGLRFGGDGTYTQSSLTIFHRLLGGGCDTAAPPVFRRVTVDAGATFVFAVL
jgi:hypothetical protein